MQPFNLNITQEIRIFISSTFRDMQDERDELIKHIFPQLKQICLERGVFLIDIDLRWGITEEQAQKNEVIQICLNEIDNSRPFFVGILGDRYGWIPDQLQKDLLLQYPWLKNYEKISVTEMEIRHGVLNNPKAASHALFYFRDPSYYNQIPKDKKAIYLEQNPESITKLKSLKRELFESNISIYENYKTPKELGKIILQDLTRIIQQNTQENPLLKKRVPLWQEIMGKEEEPRGTPIEYFLKQQILQKPFIDNLRKNFTFRNKEFEILDDFMRSDEPILILYGSKGNGKSAVIVNWLDNKRLLNPSSCIVSYHAGFGFSNNLDKTLLQLSWELNEWFHLNLKMSTFTKGLEIFYDVLKLVNEKGGTLIVIDGLDALKDKEYALKLNWIPQEIPSDIKIIISMTQDNLRDLSLRRNWVSKKIPGLTHLEQVQFISKYLGKYCKSLTDFQINQITNSDKVENPLYLKTLLDELRIFGIYEKLDAKITDLIKSKDIHDLYQKILNRLEIDFQEYDKNIAILTLKTLGCSSEIGFSEDELRGIINIAPLEWSLFYSGVNEILINRLGAIYFRDEELCTLVKERYLSSKQEILKMHLQIARYFQTQPNSRRKAEKMSWHFYKAESWEDLKNCVLDMELFTMFMNEDLAKYWKDLEKFYNPEVEYLSIAENLEGVDRTDLITLHMINRFLSLAGYDYGAEIVLRKIITLCEENEKTDSLSMTNALNDLAILLENSNRHEEAEHLYQRILSIKKNVYALTNLGVLYTKQKKFQEAEALYLEALGIIEEDSRQYVNIIPEILTAMANLFYQTNRLEEAESFYLRAVNTKKNVYTLKNLADFLYKINRTQEAESIYRQVLDIAELNFEEDYLIKAITSNELATILFGKNEFKEAELLYEHALSFFEQNENTENATFAQILINLAELYEQTGHLSKAEPLFCHAMRIYEKIFGNLHPKVADVLVRLGLLLVKLNRYQEVELLYQRSLFIYRHNYKSENLKVAEVFCNFATLYNYTNRYEEAQEYYQRALVTFEKSLGVNHPNIGIVLNGLGLQLKKQKKYENAEKNYKKALEIFKSNFGENHDTIASVLLNLGSLYIEIGRYQEAEKIYRRALTFYETIFGLDHYMVAKALMGLAHTAKFLKNYQEAEQLTRRAITIIENIYGSDHFSLCSRLITLSEILYKTNRNIEANTVLQRVLQITDKSDDQDKKTVEKIKQKVKEISDLNTKEGQSD